MLVNFTICLKNGKYHPVFMGDMKMTIVCLGLELTIYVFYVPHKTMIFF